MVSAQIMAGAFDFEQLHRGRNQSDRSFQFIEATERIPRAMHEQYWCLQLGEVRGTQLRGLARRVQGIRLQEQAIDKSRHFRRQHTGLAPAIRMSAEPDLIGLLLAKFHDLFTKTLAIARRVTGAGRTVRAILSKGKIVT